jgi:hypothetical protein
MGQQTAPPTEQTAMTAATPAALGPVSAPPDGRGQIVFFRPSRLMGMPLGFNVSENNVDLGRLGNGRYFVHVAEPGSHAYAVGHSDPLSVDVQPGMTYYVQQNITGLIGNHAVLAQADQAAFEAAAPHMRAIAPNQ